MDADIVVIGGGLAGLSAGARAAELGLTVLVLEKGSEQDYLCNSRMTGGAFHMAMGTVDRPADEVVQAMRASGLDGFDEALVRKVAERAKPGVDWLRKHGITFLRGGPLPHQQSVLAPPTLPRPGYDWKGRGGDVALRRLEAGLVAGGGTLKRGARAKALVRSEGRIVAVEAETADGGIERHGCRVVVVADGGFQGNPDFLAKYVTPRPDLVVTRGAGTAIGDGMAMAREVGAAIIDSANFYGHVLTHESHTNPRLMPFPFLDYLAMGGMLVDKSGVRLVDEGRGGIYIANMLARRADPTDAYVLFDKEIWEGPGKIAHVLNNPYLETETKSLAKGDTIDAVAEKLGIDRAALAGTVASYNEAVARQDFSALDPARSHAKAKPFALLKAPFFGIRASPGITYTMGGLKIDAACRVLDTGGAPIPGLYAAGTTVGGLEGGQYLGYMGGLARSVATGLMAAESAAELLREGAR